MWLKKKPLNQNKYHCWSPIFKSEEHCVTSPNGSVEDWIGNLCHVGWFLTWAGSCFKMALTGFIIVVDLLTSRAFKRDRRSAKREARASESSTFVPGPTTPHQKTMRTTLKKSRGWMALDNVTSRFSTMLEPITSASFLSSLSIISGLGNCSTLKHFAGNNTNWSLQDRRELSDPSLLINFLIIASGK